MKKLLGLIVVASLFLALSSQQQASAEYPYVGGCGGIGGFGYGGLGIYGSPYVSGRIPTPPYFAIHPPVYYSYPVPRTYGYSPFAYPGTKETPEIVMPVSKIITNPHVTPTGTEPIAEKNLTAQVEPKLIVNPYATTLAEIELASISIENE